MRLKYVKWVAAIIFLGSCTSKQTEVKPVEKILTEAVYASGVLIPEVEYKVMASTEGYLQQAWVKEGDSVKAGQVLFQLHSPVLQAQQQAAEAMHQQTQVAAGLSAPQFAEIQQRLEAARLRNANDSRQYERFKKLYEEGAVAKATFERYELQYHASQKETAALQEQLNQQKLNAGLQVQQARNSRQVSAAGSSRLQLASYASGVVYEVYKQVGDLVIPGQPVALIGTGRLMARLLVDEEDLGKVQPGQPVMITMDAYPDRVFKASIRRMYPILNKMEQSFRVDAELNEVLPETIHGLNIEANIIIAQNRKVVAIPHNALLKDDSVDVKESGKIMRTKIKKGIEDGHWVEVRAGLKPSSLLIIQQ